MLLFTELLMQQLLYEMFADFQQVYNHIPNHYFFFFGVFQKEKKRERKKNESNNRQFYNRADRWYKGKK